MKSPLILSKTEVRIDLSNDEIEFTNLITNKYIGNAYKNRIAEPEKWDDLIESINHLKGKEWFHKRSIQQIRIRP
jgi:hypothetical protein